MKNTTTARVGEIPTATSTRTFAHMIEHSLVSPAVMTAKVKVNDWGNTRRVIITPECVRLEVYRLSCACETCIGRFVQVANVLQSKQNTVWAWVRTDSALWIALRRNPADDWKECLKETLNLSRLKLVE